jgi:hypothetical protein
MTGEYVVKLLDDDRRLNRDLGWEWKANRLKFTMDEHGLLARPRAGSESFASFQMKLVVALQPPLRLPPPTGHEGSGPFLPGGRPGSSRRH